MDSFPPFDLLSCDFFLDIPELVVYHTVPKKLQIDTIFFTQCEPSWSRDTDTSWTILKMILLYAIPFGFMTITYFFIIQVLWKSGTVNQHAVGKLLLNFPRITFRENSTFTEHVKK